MAQSMCACMSMSSKIKIKKYATYVKKATPRPCQRLSPRSPLLRTGRAARLALLPRAARASGFGGDISRPRLACGLATCLAFLRV